jgi:hypothetical protein
LFAVLASTPGDEAGSSPVFLERDVRIRRYGFRRRRTGPRRFCRGGGCFG